MLNEATARNLARKKTWADHLQVNGGIPLFSWLDLSITELCNRSHGHPRACQFCPRIDPAFYPNQKLHMPLGLGDKIAAELHSIHYEGAVVLCGYGEPMLHPNIVEFVRAFKGLRVEIVTNGDQLTATKVAQLLDVGASFFAVSLYDGPHQAQPIRDLFAKAGAEEGEHFILRDRWHGPDEDFGLKLTNRAGTVTVGTQLPVNAEAPCFYPSYSMAVDWNGDVLLCVQDWHKRVRFGNLWNQNLLDVWTSKQMHKRRMQVGNGRRVEAPCSTCNAEGTCHGREHFAVWKGDRP